jgi:hypothetical protein
LPSGIDEEAMRVAMNNIPVGPKDAAWLEDWFADQTDVVDPTQNESLVGPSGIAYGVAGMGGHDPAGSEALTKLGQAKLEAGEVPPITTTVFDGSELAIELFDETVGPEQDGWDRDENGTLSFQFITHMAGEAFPIRLTVEKQDDGKYAIITRSNRGSVRFDMLASRVGSAQEIAGSDRFAHFESEEKAKQFMEALVFGKASTFTIDVIGSGEGTRSYFFARVPPEALEAVGLDPSKNIVPEYNWTDAHVPPILASTEEDAAEQLVKYVEGRTSQSADRSFAMSGGAAGNITGEDAILAMGFLRISRMGGERGPDVGISWNAAAGLTDAQRRVAVKVAKDTVERDGRMAFERSGAYEPTRQRFGNRVSGVVPPFPDNYFTSTLQGKSLALRSHDGIPAWAERVLIQRGGPGSGHFKHEGREGERGGSSPGDRLPKDRGEQMKQAKQDFQSEPPKKREPVGAVASHIGVGYRVNLTAEAFSKYRPAVSAALEWAAREFKRVFGGQVEGVTIHDDPVAFVEANIPEMYAESMAKLGEKDKREVEAGIREDHSRLRAAYNPLTKQVLVNVGKHIEPGGALDTEGVMASATHEFVHWATFGSGRDEIWKEVKVPRAFKDIFRPRYGESLIKQEYVARVVSSEMRGSDMLTMPGDTEALAMSEQDHKNARILMDKISNSFVAPNLEMPTTLRVSPERLVDVTVPDGLGNFWGRAVPESQLDSLPAGSTVNAIYAMLKGEEAFEEGRTIRPDVLSLNWLDETDPARHPVRQQITKKPRLDDVTVAIRSQDNVLERVLDTIGGALRELMGMKHG